MKLRIVLVAALATAVSLAFGDRLDVSQFAKTFTVVVPASSVPNGAVADFPALVRLSTAIDGFSYSDFRQQGGADLAFVDSEGNVLPHEIDTWNPGGESLVWVKVPLLSDGATIRVYYGRIDYAPAVAATSVWSAYTGVWHMREASGTAYDSTANGLDAAPAGNDTEQMVAYESGAVGKARVNQAANTSINNRMEIPNYDSFALGDTFTFSGWFNISSQDGWNRIASRKESWGKAGMEIELNASTAGMLDVYGNGGDNIAAAWPSSMDNGWAQLVFVYSGSTVRYYANGVFVAEKNDIVPITDNGQVLALGNNATGNERSFFGRYDEVRLSGATLAAERIAADYATVHDKGFFVYSAVNQNITIDPANYTRFVQLTIGSSAIADSTFLSGVPVLVRLSTAISGFDYNDFRLSRGGDLVFADADGNVLAHEIDVWDTSGESFVWVKVPLLFRGTAIYAYWGSATASPLASTATWSAYKGVWHMNESGSTVEPDVSGNGLNATPAGDSAADIEKMEASEGIVGTSRKTQTTEYDSSKHNRYVVPAYSLGGTFTVSCWVNEQYDYGWHRIFTCKEGAGDSSGWHIECGGKNSGMVTIIGSGSRGFDANIGLLVDRWTHLAFVFEGTEASVYTNGVLCASGTINEATASSTGFAIGGTPLGRERTLEGYFDEVRLGEAVLSAGRIAADYAIVHDTSFVSFGAVGVPAANAPVMATPVFSKNALGEIEISVSMLSGTGTPYVRFTTADGNTDVALSEGIVTGPQSYTVAIPSNLAADKTYSFAAVGVNAAGGETVAEGSGVFYNGTLSVAKTSDADEDGPVAGVFTVSRADSYGDLPVKYSLSGTAVAGTDYVGSASGTVVIPNGSTSATVSIVPKVNSAVNVDTTVVFAFAGGFYSESVSTATMTIANLAPVTRREFLKRIDFSFPMEFLADGETLTNFPALVKLSTAIPGFSYSDFQLANGGDMMFTDSRGQVIPSEVDAWNSGGTSLVWVSVPELTKGTVVKMYYGNGANPAGVPLAKWPDYAGVWHMGEASGTAYDSTANGFDAVAVQNARARAEDLVAVADGAIGAGRVNQDGTTYYDVGTYDAEILATARRNYLSVPSGCDGGLGSFLSFSGWFRTVGGTEWSEPMVFKRASGYNYGWSIARRPSVGSTDVKIAVHVADGGGEFAIPDMRNTWVHIFVSFDRVATGETDNPHKTVASVYANGVLLGTAAGSTRIWENDYPLTFGNIDSTTQDNAFYGQYDELRLKRGASSANWAKAEYLTVADASFVSASGAQPAVPGLMIFVR